MSTDRTHLMSYDMLQNVVPAGKFLLIYLVYLMIYRLDLRNKLVIFVGYERSYLCNGNVQVRQRIIMDYHGNFPLVAVPEVVKLVGQRQRTLNVSAFIYLLYLFNPTFQQIILIVQFAVVETTGKVSVYPKFKNRPVTNEDMDIKNSSPDPPAVVVQDGVVMDSSLKRLGLGRQWLDKILSENSVDPTDIFMMTAETAAKYRIIKKELSTECRGDKIIEKG